MTVRQQPPQSVNIRMRTALVLVAAVVLAHMLALRFLSDSLPTYGGSLSTHTFLTRAVQILPPATVAARLPARPVTRVPRPGPPTAVRQRQRPVTEGVLSASERVMEPQAPAPALLPDPPDETPVAVAEPAPAASAAEPMPAQAVAPAAAPASAPVAATESVAATSEPAAEPTASTASAPSIAADGAAPLRPLTVPGSIRLSFDATGKRGRLDYKAMGSLSWRQDGSHYDMRLEMGDWIIGKRVLSSTGDITGAGLAPTRFSDKFRSERAAHFDRQNGRITFSANTPQATLLPGAQDQLSIFAQLAAMVGGDPGAFPVGTTVTVQTAGTRNAEPWVFTMEREELLYLPGGQVPTLKLARLPNKDYDQTVELWLAPELGYLPARIKISFANGDYIDQQWTSSSSP